MRPGVICGVLFVWSAMAAGPEECAACHREAAGFGRTAMGRALAKVSDNPTPRLEGKVTGYSYQIDRGVMTVSDGRETLRVPLEWAFGDGKVGQTYLFRRDGVWYESRVSYFAGSGGLDVTLGQQGTVPRDLIQAAGRAAGAAEVKRCFGCHATSVTGGDACERCHGVAESHVKSGAAMKRLGSLTTEEVSDFCGECHRTWAEIAAKGPRGIQNIRFQPYRLAGSKCYSATDERIKCTACHDPHRPLVTDIAAYDTKCGACHKAGACRVGSRSCAACHMLQLELPGAHRKFTDHRIRVARTGEEYPD